MEDKSYYFTSAEFTLNHQLYTESIDFMNKYIELQPKLDDDLQNLFIAPYRELLVSYRFTFNHICEIFFSTEEEDISETEKTNLDKLRIVIIEKIKDICQMVFDKIDSVLYDNAEDINKPKLKLFYADFKRYIAELDIDISETAAEESKKNYDEAIELCAKYLHVAHPVKLNSVLNLGILLTDVFDLTEDSLQLLQKCVDEVKDEIDKLESEDDKTLSLEIIEKMQDLL